MGSNSSLLKPCRARCGRTCAAQLLVCRRCWWRLSAYLHARWAAARGAEVRLAVAREILEWLGTGPQPMGAQHAPT